METGWNRVMPRADRDTKIRIGGDKLLGKFDDRDLRHMNLQVTKERAGKPLINENPAVLRIVGELYDVKRSVFGLHQMSLSASTHFANQSAGANRHRSLLR